ncbi:hypothetical protein [Cellulosimicrobium sp. Marseille-Q4280]|uniref:hypothetical protein n=1 Tax=Cellulosimicrobium sp. Marseille-Q4280 TaxID=2937992 RepID=UPI00203D5253|nr:hypothetical protein [Cellulosimicrobium sp. Marseille-Q4280]
MEHLTRWSLPASPVILRPGSIAHTPAAPGGLAKVWINAIWLRRVNKKPVATFGSLWGIAPLGQDGTMSFEDVVAHLDPRRHDPDHDGVVTFTGTGVTVRTGRRAANPRRARDRVHRLVELHTAAAGASAKVLPQVPDGWEGWYRLAGKGVSDD